MLARPQPHCAGLLADQADGLGLGGFRGAGAAAQQSEPVAQSPRLLEIERLRRSFHFNPNAFDLIHARLNAARPAWVLSSLPYPPGFPLAAQRPLSIAPTNAGTPGRTSSQSRNAGPCSAPSVVL